MAFFWQNPKGQRPEPAPIPLSPLLIALLLKLQAETQGAVETVTGAHAKRAA